MSIPDTSNRKILWVTTPMGRRVYQVDTDALSEAMVQAGMRPKDVAIAACMSNSMISDIGKGRRQPSEKILMAIATVLGVKPQTLLQQVPDALRSAEPQDGVSAA